MWFKRLNTRVMLAVQLPDPPRPRPGFLSTPVHLPGGLCRHTWSLARRCIACGLGYDEARRVYQQEGEEDAHG